jgi:hypothetical protein
VSRVGLRKIVRVGLGEAVDPAQELEETRIRVLRRGLVPVVGPGRAEEQCAAEQHRYPRA